MIPNNFVKKKGIQRVGRSTPHPVLPTRIANPMGGGGKEMLKKKKGKGGWNSSFSAILDPKKKKEGIHHYLFNIQ